MIRLDVPGRRASVQQWAVWDTIIKTESMLERLWLLAVPEN